MSEKVRTRFAPSPTGYMHVGGVRTALFAWLVARQNGGEFLLRFEDTDRQRHVADAEKHIVQSLNWLGIDWDNKEIYRQSEKLDNYTKWAKKMVSSGRAYVDTTSEEERAQQRQSAKDRGTTFRYKDHRPAESEQWNGSQLLRFKSEPRPYEWTDEVMGPLRAPAESIDDFVLMKSDGYPTYDFAHIVDDYEMGITHVMRSQEFASSVPKYLNLYEALGIDRPKLALLPYVLAPDGKKKLSKRDGAKDAMQYKKEGYLPETMLNFLATLGWNDGTEQELFSRQELIDKFSLDRVQRSGAHFDERRLQWMNGHYIRQLPDDELMNTAEKFWGAGKKADKNKKQQVLSLVKDRLKFLGELPELTDFFFNEPDIEKVLELYTNPLDKGIKKLDSLALAAEMLEKSAGKLEASDFSEEGVRECLNTLLAELDTNPATLFPIIRIAVSGQASTPELFGTLAVLGKKTTIARMDLAASRLAQRT